MKQAIQHIGVATRGRGLVEFTRQVRAFVEQQPIRNGLLTLFCRHTSASLLIQENADPSVRRDLERYFEEIAPEDASRYEHTTTKASTTCPRICARRSPRCSCRSRSSRAAWCSAPGREFICSSIAAPRTSATWSCI